MSQVVTTNEIKDLLKLLEIKWDDFLEEHCNTFNVSYDTSRAILYGRVKFTKQRQEEFTDTIKRLSDKKSTNDFDRVKIQKDLTAWAYNAFVRWIKTEDIDTLAAYWYNHGGIYAAIDKYATQFLYRCIGITAPASQVDRRVELLEFMQDYSSSVAAMQKSMPLIKIFLNVDESLKKRESDYKKSKVYKNKDNPDVVEQYRNELERQFEQLFYENEGDKAAVIYNQAGFITTMDKTDWDLLIAYTLVRADDENGEKIQQIRDKLESLIQEGKRA